MVILADPAPPTSPVTPPAELTDLLMTWLGYTAYIGLAISILAVIMLGSMLILDKRRGEPVSATSPHVRALRIALGVIVLSSAASLATFFS